MGLVLGGTGKNFSDISHSPLLILEWSKSPKLGIDFRYHSPLRRSKHALEAPMISLVHPTLTTGGHKIPSLQKKTGREYLSIGFC